MPRTAANLMWADALAIVARADRLHREFFRPAPSGWEPPVDLLETADELILVAALPGVRATDVELVIAGGELAIVGTRRLPALPGRTRIHRMELPHGHFELGGRLTVNIISSDMPGRTRIHRMELPHGHFERRIALPPGAYDLSRRELVDGCLTVVLRKMA